MTTMIVMRETEDGVRLTWHQDELPAYRTEEYPDAATARAAHPAPWRDPDSGADGDVLAVADA